MTARLFVFLMYCFVATTAHAQTETSPEAVAKLEPLLNEAFAHGDYVGLSVAVVEGGETAFLNSWGATEPGGAPVGPDTVFAVASLSKGFAATAAALLAAENKLDYAERVSNVRPGLALQSERRGRVATLEHVLSHQLGLPPNAYDNLLEHGLAVNEIWSRLNGVKPICSVGACYSYQNVAYSLLEPAIERAAGAPYAQVVRSSLLEPLGMTTASVGIDGLLNSASFAKPHRRRGKDSPWRALTPDADYYRTPAAGGVNASIADMALWLKAQMGYAPDILSPETLEEIHRPRIKTRRETIRQRWLEGRVRDSHYGFGWRIYDYAGHTLVTHSGGIRGYRAQIAFLPERDIGVVALWNSEGRSGWGVAPTYFDLALGLEPGDWLRLEDDDSS